MTVDTTISEAGPLTPNGVTTAFPFDFVVGSATELVVIIDDVEVDSGDYTVTLNADNEGGTVTFAVAPTGDELFIKSNPDFTQNIQFENAGAFLPATHDEAFDRAAIKDIYLNRRIGEVQETLIEDFVSLYSLATLGSNSFLSKAEATAAITDIPVGEMVQVYVDETKDFTWSIYRKVTGGLEYLFSLANTQDLSEDATGILFDTAGADNFTDLIYTANADLTVTDAQAAFSDASAVDRVMTVPASDGVTPLYFCFDNWTIDATFTVTSFPSAGVDGVYISGRYYLVGSADADYGMRIAAHGAAATTAQITAISGSQILEQTHTEAGLPKTIRIRYTHDLETDIATHTANINGGADIQLTEAYPAAPSGAAHPTRMLSPTIRFKQGVLTCTAFKFSAGYPNATFGFMGDSITIWPVDGFAHLTRADYPGEVLIAGASGTTTGDWLYMVESVTRMKPRYLFVMLGTNDVVTAVPLATTQANYTSLISDLLAADIVPIILTTPPQGSANVPILNAWIEAQGWRYLDVYSMLVGVGTALDAAYDNGDGIHLNAAGHIVVHDAIEDYIVAQGLV